MTTKSAFPALYALISPAWERGSPRVEDLALPKSLKSGNFTLAKAVIRWMSVGVLAGLLGAVGPQRARAADTEVKLTPQLTAVLPAEWQVAPAQARNLVEIERRATALPGAPLKARTAVTTELRPDHTDAVHRLQEIAAESGGNAQFVAVCGWPALERRAQVLLPHVSKRGPFDARPLQTTVVTVVVAVGDTIVRYEGTLEPGAEASYADEIVGLAEKLRCATAAPKEQLERELQMLNPIQSPPPPPSPALAPPPSAPPPRTEGQPPSPAEAPPGGSRQAAVFGKNGFGELQIAVSTDGKNVLLATNNGNAISSDGGVSYNPSALPPFPFCTPGGPPCTQGDPSVGVGKSGKFYFAILGLPTNGCSAVVSSSTDNGKTFTVGGNAALCTNGAKTCFPDQEQMAADGTNSTSSGDQIYVVWRNFPAPNGVTQCNQIVNTNPTPTISCSTNSGMTWANQTAVGTGDVGRITVGGDGSVFVTYVSGSNLMINKFSSCANGLTVVSGFPHQIASITGTTCPIPGLDRCDSSSEGSPQPAVDDTNSQNVLVAYADNTGDGNDDVVVRRSRDGGVTWPDVNTANAKVTARRFLPWICVSKGTAHVTWYDRRTATSSNNSLTTYYWSAGFPRLLGESGQFSGAETNVSGSADPECASGFPFSFDNTNDATSCQPAPTSPSGTCFNATGGGSKVGCNFNSPVCPVGETCQPPLPGRCFNSTGGGSKSVCNLNSPVCPTVPTPESCQLGLGQPKYGDYNGNACAADKVYLAWASATPPPGITNAPSGINVYAATGSPALPCKPKISCDVGAQCGIQDDGCGGTLTCGGACPSGSVCNDVNRCASGCEAICVHQWEACRDCEGPGCVEKIKCLPQLNNCKATLKPKTCAELGQQCGPANDGCGRPLDCGGCSAGSTCSGGRCSCVPKSSCNPGAQCGTQEDGCGGTLGCGTCPSGSVCNNAANRCESNCKAVCTQKYLSCLNCDRSEPGCPLPSQCAAGRRACEAACP
jgi:hypothetical protein